MCGIDVVGGGGGGGQCQAMGRRAFLKNCFPFLMKGFALLSNDEIYFLVLQVRYG